MALAPRCLSSAATWQGSSPASCSARVRVRHSLSSSSRGASFALHSKYSKGPKWIAQVVPFKASRRLDVAFQCGALAPEDYVKEVERVVKVAFPDSARIRFLGDYTWRATLKPVTFFHLSATPFCDLRVSHDNQKLILSSNRIDLDFKGFPDEFKNLDLDFSLLGHLTVAETGRTSPSSGQIKRFKGSVNMGLKVDMPLPFSMMPEAVLTPVGDGVLDRILGAMESALLAGLVKDYKEWCKKHGAKTSGVPVAAELVVSS